jgi:Protein of unknown function (DUF1326)
MTTPLSRLAVLLLGFALCLLPGTARAASTADALPPTPNALETHEFHIQNARLPTPLSAHQNVTAWQVAQGSWNGQSLDGLSLVFVQSTADAGIPARLTNCYISQEANPAQRAALVDAFLASNTQSITPSDLNLMRVEPAVISIEVDGQSVILHLGLLA